MIIQGLHHITLGASDAQQTVDFYTRVLGLMFVKKTVNFDDPRSYHLYFGDETGRPGTAITFFEWPGVPRGRPGIGGTHHFALQTADLDSLLMWKRRLQDLGIEVTGPLNRKYFTSIYFRDLDGTILEIATRGPGFAVDEDVDHLGNTVMDPPDEYVIGGRDEQAVRTLTWDEPVPDILPDMSLHGGMHHITAIGADIERTDAFYSGLLGLQRVKKTANFDDSTSAHWYWGTDKGRPGSLITYFERDPAHAGYRRMGVGQTHHFAFSVTDEQHQLEWRERLIQAGLRVSPVMDRVYFKSIYTNDPDGHIVELATAGPGFLVDEDVRELGTNLQLPPWLEDAREEIEATLRPIEHLALLEVQS